MELNHDKQLTIQELKMLICMIRNDTDTDTLKKSRRKKGKLECFSLNFYRLLL